MSLTPKHSVPIQNKIRTEWAECGDLSDVERCVEVMRFIQRQNVYCVWFLWPILKPGIAATDLAIYIPGVIVEVASKVETGHEPKKLCLRVKHEFTSITEWEAPVVVELELDLCHLIAGHRWNSATILKYRQDAKAILIRYKELKTPEVRAYRVMRRIAIELLQKGLSHASNMPDILPNIKPAKQSTECTDQATTPASKRPREPDVEVGQASKRSRPWPAPVARKSQKPISVTPSFAGPSIRKPTGGCGGAITRPASSVSFSLKPMRMQGYVAAATTSALSQLTNAPQQSEKQQNSLFTISVEKNVAYEQIIEQNKCTTNRYFETVKIIHLQATALDKQVKTLAGNPSALACQSTAIILQLENLAAEMKKQSDSLLSEAGADARPLPQAPDSHARAAATSPSSPTAIRACTDCDGWMVLQNASRAMGNNKPDTPAYIHVGGRCPRSANGLLRHSSRRYPQLEYILDRYSPKHEGFLAALGYPAKKLITIPQSMIYPGSNRVPFNNIPQREANVWLGQKKT